MPAVCFGLHILMNCISRTCTAFSGNVFFGLGQSLEASCSSQRVQAKHCGLLKPCPSAPLRVDHEPTGEKKQKSGSVCFQCRGMTSLPEVMTRLLNKLVGGLGFTAQKGHTLVNRPHD